ncbi:alpha-hydroxy-acid oxidizing protein [Filobacillus milosensis]|uniref:L-lactate oxidase n=1 Tax=Filobacillus milosensis TaxID=94137 RepID=A0A4Y8IIS4_9BACI|nr:lactate 2-monooxygenase [Filobacillus milosensis]TFB19582.1 alpha-hydroxy-acid oxidizing protein [Filobacillus milosensis]
MKNIGNQVQYSIYQTMQNPDPNRLPISYEDWEKEARKKLEDGPFYYIAGGAGGERTMDSNVSGFNRWQIIPRMLNNVDERDLSIELFGQTYPSPSMLAPIGVQSIIHEEGEIGSAKACAELGIPYTTSSASSVPMEKIAEAMGDAPRWFQLYWSRDPEITASFLKRADASGYSAIVVTLDTPMMAWREEDLKNVYLPFLIGEGLGNYFTDPAFLSKLEKSPKEDPQSAIMHWTQIFGNTGLTWDDISFLKEHTNLPILLKGILHPDDAKLALDYGVDGVIVSNHGGRQVDGAISAIDALPLVKDVVGDKIPVLMDSGIRRGSDIIKAMSLGASAVLVGRPAMYGLAVAGQQGVKEVMRNMLADLDITLGLIGKRTVKDLGPSVLKTAGDKVDTQKSHVLY